MQSTRNLMPFVGAMTVIVAASNWLVQFPFDHFGLGEILTWGAFSYPVAFLVNDLCNRRLGPGAARKVVIVGFALAVILSAWLATPRIAVASGSAFLTAQLLDISIFSSLRRQNWWKAPLLSTIAGSILDTIIFFSLAFSAAFAFIDSVFSFQDGSLAFPVSFAGGEIPLWVSLALGDLCVKMIVGLVMLVPYGALMSLLRPVRQVPA